MILKASQRGGGRQLALHLLNTRDNDHVEVVSVDGCIAADVAGAFAEMYAISRATRCRQYLFSVSLSPPKDAFVQVADFEAAIDQIAEKLGLSGQPKVVLFHEKQGRRHAHCVWSRINVEKMRAVNLPFFKERLTELSRELYLTHDWDLPKGLADPSFADPLNFGLTEWHEAKNAKRDPREIKAVMKRCWAQSDSAEAFTAALKERGFWLAQGDRRGFVALDYKGNVYSLSRWLDVKGKELQARLGVPSRYRSVVDTQAEIVSTTSAVAQRLLEEIERKQSADLQPLLEQRVQIVARQRRERREVEQRQIALCEAETRKQTQRVRRGLIGMWDWVTGRRHKLIQQAKLEMLRLEQGITEQREALRKRQRDEMVRLYIKISRVRGLHAKVRDTTWRALDEEVHSPPIMFRHEKDIQKHLVRRRTDLELDQG
ncbi:relaxase/mobilization nuclease domain-containing protein [Ancylobacter sp. 6x-1]|uniref:Relaxase/mobilization nuclease domain-containing protein n=1 Tax=Ancylobacter crimeensis TaxID=2579147 RepID=A0ABT0DBT5_9HYPH|nr:relaxase/mobilization nuclease domain-containing protein [Ancylobacter crimeensis]MCK0197426.1 relaxase/mobilization nuclease domain-containing protein [Ancylobacter crimeensis]